ncbi:uncharacterized protein BDZ99DRAFT_229752 [Mytilinidion resinicola]|uniref:Uncharacterized protein n=1 Tax=Mytilinidion resinicola TaxID=574789 RepID=A0A6A6YZ02_9PEZI|nr:uncharacterized protein BDZ99DRAFT_229752 [Mytilinidion resinicola]KAF2813980.1 hypothetical protein BDZ99DRAFT_229752 [Mytilinidion resinicola]
MRGLEDQQQGRQRLPSNGADTRTHSWFHAARVYCTSAARLAHSSLRQIGEPLSRSSAHAWLADGRRTWPPQPAGDRRDTTGPHCMCRPHVCPPIRCSLTRCNRAPPPKSCRACAACPHRAQRGEGRGLRVEAIGVASFHRLPALTKQWHSDRRPLRSNLRLPPLYYERSRGC